jgi:hypothetical protein
VQVFAVHDMPLGQSEFAQQALDEMQVPPQTVYPFAHWTGVTQEELTQVSWPVLLERTQSELTQHFPFCPGAPCTHWPLQIK